MPPRKSLPTRSRELALEVLEDVRRGSFAEHALSDRLEKAGTLRDEDRGLATELVYGVLRWRTRLERIIKQCSKHPSDRIRPDLREILDIALYQIFVLDRIPDHAAVDQAVIQARTRLGSRTAAFVNAILRRALRERATVDPLPGDDPVSLADYYSHPIWLVKRWIKEFGPQRTRRILSENNLKPPLMARVNRLKTTRERFADLLQRNGVTADLIPLLSDGVRIASMSGPVQALPGYKDGLFMVQDTAAQLIAPLLGVQKGDRVLDACAAPGGKTSHLAALARNWLRIVAIESDPVRLEETRKNLDRLGVDAAELVHGDASDPAFVKSLGEFDRVLLDPPCTNLGVLRRSPEARYRSRPSDPAVFAQIQLKMLNATAPVLKPGGMLLYSVCTVSEEETAGVVTQFLDTHQDFRLVPIRAGEVNASGLADEHGFFRTFPSPEIMLLDGFFAARLQRWADRRKA
ncbi:MAG: 16S rRNA (cytosine(967)-C(5))-methyltransferase RsmB [Deltaproteobacteria bacterium]